MRQTLCGHAFFAVVTRGVAGSLDPACPHDTGTVKVGQASDGRERAAPQNVLHTVDKRGSDAKLGFLGTPGFETHQRASAMPELWSTGTTGSLA